MRKIQNKTTLKSFLPNIVAKNREKKIEKFDKKNCQ